MLHLHSTRPALLRYDSVSAFSLRPCRLSPEKPSPSSLAFFSIDKHRPLCSLKLKKQPHHHHPLFACQASQSDISSRFLLSYANLSFSQVEICFVFFYFFNFCTNCFFLPDCEGIFSIVFGILMGRAHTNDSPHKFYKHQ